jgi:hypothetical protein
MNAAAGSNACQEITKLKTFIELFRSSLLLAALSLYFGSSQAAIIDVHYDGGGSFGTDVFIDVTSSGGADIASIDIVTAYDPSAGPIIKHFITDGLGGVLILDESITNSGFDTWVGWDEAVDTLGSGGSVNWSYEPSITHPDGTFSEGPLLVDTNADGTGDTLFPGLAFDFHPSNLLLPGQTVELMKTIVYDPGITDIFVYEWPRIGSEGVPPVPIPATAWLFGSALGLLGWMRRKAA